MREGEYVVRDVVVSAAAVGWLQAFGLVRNDFYDLPRPDRRAVLQEAVGTLLNDRLPEVLEATEGSAPRGSCAETQ